MTIKIRKADLNKDALAIVEGAKDFMSRLEHQSLVPEENEIAASISGIISNPAVEITVAEYRGDIVGGLGMVFSPWVWNPKIVMADELFWWGSASAPFKASHMLFRHIMDDLEERGVVATFKALANSPDGVERLYKKNGFVLSEVSYMRQF